MEFPLNVILLKTLKQLKEKLAVYAMNSYLYNSIFSSNELSNKNKGEGGRTEIWKGGGVGRLGVGG